MSEPVAAGIQQEAADNTSKHTSDASNSFSIPANVLKSLGVTASDLENPSKEMLQKLIEQYSISLEYIDTAKIKLNQYGDEFPLIVASHSTSHCVRCHKNYTECSNVEGACVVSHWGYLDIIGGRGSEMEWEWDGCGCIIEGEDPGYNDGDEICYRTRHTTNQDHVIYNKRHSEDEDDEEEDEEDSDEDDDEEEENPGPEGKYRDKEDIGAVTCWQRGCNMKVADAEEQK